MRLRLYLRLFAYRLQIPQVYGLLTLGKGDAPEVLLSEEAPIYTDAVPLVAADARIDQCLKEATSMRQLNCFGNGWLLAASSTEGVASSLLDPSCYEWKDR